MWILISSTYFFNKKNLTKIQNEFIWRKKIGPRLREINFSNCRWDQCAVGSSKCSCLGNGVNHELMAKLRQGLKNCTQILEVDISRKFFVRTYEKKALWEKESLNKIFDRPHTSLSCFHLDSDIPFQLILWDQHFFWR